MTLECVKYNPAFLSEEKLIESFVVRQLDLEMIIRVIEENSKSTNTHVLVLGARGMGKTTLVLRVAAEIGRNVKLAENWYPVVFPEESYQVSTPGEFWLQGILRLGGQEGSHWKKVFDDLNKEKDENRLRERALAQLMDFADSKKKRLLFIVENLNMLLGDQISHKDAWVLRHTLINEPRIMILGTATHRFDEFENVGKAMYELFKPHLLPPLDEIECGKIWALKCGSTFAENGFRPIQILTGGNPRLLAIISSFCSNQSFRDLMKNLMQLVDDHTEYFKSHLDNLASVERKVFLSLAEYWNPATASEVAEIARLEVNKASSLLGRLVDRGFVSVYSEEARKKKYQVSERLYNIYYLMRGRSEQSDRVKALVNFMTDFYDPQKLVEITQKIASEALELPPEGRGDFKAAYWGILGKFSNPDLKKAAISGTPKDFFEPDENKFLHETPEDLEFSETQVKALKEYLNRPETKKLLTGNFEEALKEISQNFGGLPWDIWHWESFGDFLLFKVENFQGAEFAYRKAVEISPHYFPNLLNLGIALFCQSQKKSEAEEIFGKAQKMDPKSGVTWYFLGLCYLHREDLKKAEHAFKNSLALDPEDWVSWDQLGELYEKMERFEEAEKAYLKAIECKSGSWIWVSLGDLYNEKLNRPSEAEKAFMKAIESDPENSFALNRLGNFYQKKIRLLMKNSGSQLEALQEAKRYLELPKLVGKQINETIELFIEFAVLGFAKESIEILSGSSCKGILEPLIIGLKLFEGQEVQAAFELLEVGKDVRNRIQEHLGVFESCKMNTNTPSP